MYMSYAAKEHCVSSSIPSRLFSTTKPDQQRTRQSRVYPASCLPLPCDRSAPDARPTEPTRVQGVPLSIRPAESSSPLQHAQTPLHSCADDRRSRTETER